MMNKKLLSSTISAISATLAVSAQMENETGLPFEFVSLGSTAENTAARINIYDRIGGSWWEDGITAQAFVSQLSAIDDASEVTLHISTDGGDTKDGTVMYNELVKRKGVTNVMIDGYAISMGSLIAMAGKNSGGKTTMAKNALMMVHKPLSEMRGNSDDFRKQAELLDKVEDALISPYVEATGKSKEEIKEMLAATTWMTAEEALSHGFITDISEKETAVNACFSKTFMNENKGKFGNIPESFINQFIVAEKVEPVEPVVPVAPVEAVAPVEPVVPVAPVEAVAPVAPVDLVKLERARCAEITRMCLANNLGHKSQSFIDKGYSLIDAQDIVMEIKATLEESIVTINAQAVKTTGVQGGWAEAYNSVPNLKKLK
jgi:ATP-dependent Clp endopeptidase proteolytic subunit ClpP